MSFDALMKMLMPRSDGFRTLLGQDTANLHQAAALRSGDVGRIRPKYHWIQQSHPFEDLPHSQSGKALHVQCEIRQFRHGWGV